MGVLTEGGEWVPLIPSLARASSLGSFFFQKALGVLAGEGRGHQVHGVIPCRGRLPPPGSPPGRLYGHRHRPRAALVHPDNVADFPARFWPLGCAVQVAHRGPPALGRPCLLWLWRSLVGGFVPALL